MQDYVVRSTVTHAESAARRAADVIITLFFCAAAVFVLFRFVWVPVAVASPQVNELEDGELVIADRISKWFAEYEPGDIVRADTGDGMNMYRVAVCAAPGGDMELEISGGRLYVNGGLLDESAYTEGFDPSLELFETLPSGSVLLLPDDRGGIASLDKYMLPVNEVYGKLRFRIYPFNKLSLFK